MGKPGAAVLDVGITRTDAGLVGDVAPEVAQAYGISGVPTLVLFRGGRAVDRVVGFTSARSLKAWLEAAAASPAAAQTAK